ncbi:MAG: hypothetical protein J6Z31_02115 [Fibrobacter sp.]|nr:hypothetical protein [Fibrobacter sp.]
MTKLDEILQSLNASNHDLVEMLPLNLNHKMVQKARLGKKPVPRHTQDLILQALNKFLTENGITEDKKVKQYKRVEIFGESSPLANSENLD